MLLQLYAKQMNDELDAVLAKISIKFVKLEGYNRNIRFNVRLEVLGYLLLNCPICYFLKLVGKAGVQKGQVLDTPPLHKHTQLIPSQNMDLDSIHFFPDACIKANFSDHPRPQANLSLIFLVQFLVFNSER